MGAGEGAKVMKKEYKRFGGMLYCYDPNTDYTVRIYTVRIYRDGADIVTYNFKLSDWEAVDVYERCTKKEFKTALSAAIKRLRDVTK